MKKQMYGFFFNLLTMKKYDKVCNVITAVAILYFAFQIIRVLI